MQYKNIMSKLNTSGRYKQQFFFIHVPSINEYILGSYTSLYDEQKPHTEYCTESHKYLYLYILIHSDKNVELQLYAKIVFLKYVSSISLNYR